MNRERRRLALGALSGILVASLAVALVVIIVRTWTLVAEVEANTSTTRHVQRTNAATLKRLVDCTTPGHSCFEVQQSRTAAAIDDLNYLGVLRVACADRRGYQNPKVIQACITRTLNRFRR